MTFHQNLQVLLNGSNYQTFLVEVLGFGISLCEVL